MKYLGYMIAALLISASVAVPAARAGTIGVHTFSEHARAYFERTHEGALNSRHKFNESNFGAYYVTDNGWTIGTYRNSYYRQTFYAGYVVSGPTLLAAGPFSIRPDLSMALATGYKRVYGVGVLRPMLMPQIVIQSAYGPAIRYSVAPGKEGVFQHLSVEVKL